MNDPNELVIRVRDYYADPTGCYCPRCHKRSIVYNGNYFCNDEECGWVAKERELRHEWYEGLMKYRNG